MHERMLILIPCSGSKREGGVAKYDRSNCIVNDLSFEVGKKLMELRKQVAMAFHEEPGLDLGFEDVGPRIKYLEAYNRYSGNLYSRISESSWKMLSKNPELNLIIVSALYGLVNYNEPIRYYNITMKNHIYPGRLLKTWWKNQNLSNILLDYVTKNKIEVVYDFLSDDYAQAVEHFPLSVKKIGVQYFSHTYSGLGSGSNYYRGEEVNKLIQRF